MFNGRKAMAIVIVDDSATSLIILKHMTRSQCNAPVHTYACSDDARQFLSGNAADLIVVDCEMPSLNGIEFIGEIRRYKHHARTPILMVTQHHESEIRRQALAAGATAFLNKPVKTDEFKALVRELLTVQVASAMSDPFAA
jgi:CheY-like chemotaxis protein